MQKLKGLWIPAEILLNEDLSDKEKIILSMILYLSEERKSCFASNKYIANIVNVTHERVSKIIRSLKDKGYVTGFENSKTVLQDIELQLPDVLNIKDFSKIMLGRDEKIDELIIKPKDNLIKKLHEENRSLHHELYKQCRLVYKAEKYEKERQSILAENKEIKENLKTLENDYAIKLKQEIRKVENKYEDEIYNLKKENRFLNKIINTFEKTVNKFIKWIVKKFDIVEEDNLIRDFEKETHTFLDPEKQIKKEEREREWDLER